MYITDTYHTFPHMYTMPGQNPSPLWSARGGTVVGAMASEALDKKMVASSSDRKSVSPKDLEARLLALVPRLEVERGRSVAFMSLLAFISLLRRLGHRLVMCMT